MRVNRFRLRPTLKQYLYVAYFIGHLRSLGAYDAFVKLLQVNGEIEYWDDDKLTRSAVSHYLYKRLAYYRERRSVDLVFDAVIRNWPPQGMRWWLEISKAIPIFKRYQF